MQDATCNDGSSDPGNAESGADEPTGGHVGCAAYAEGQQNAA